jgi:hypothetical protein
MSNTPKITGRNSEPQQKVRGSKGAQPWARTSKLPSGISRPRGKKR